jgi:hypothetical protein
MRTPLALALLAVTGAVAHAEPAATPTWSARAALQQRWMTAPSAVTLTESTLFGWGLAIDRQLATVGLPGPLPDVSLAGEVGMARASAEGMTFQQLHNHLATWEVTAGVRARVPVWDWLHLQGRAAVGGGAARVRIADAAMPTTAIADRDARLVATTGLGLALLPQRSSPGRSGWWWGVELELGWHAGTSPTVHAAPEDRPPPELTIPAHHAALGALDLDGWTFGLAMTMGF